MSISARSKNAIKVALADLGAANEVLQALGNDAGLGQAVGTTDSVTFAGLTVTADATVGTTLGVTGIATFSNDVKIASGHVLKVNNIQVVGAQQTAVTPVAVTFSSNTPSTYGSPTGTLTVSDGATPTVVELVKYCNELRKNIVDIQAVLHAHGLTT